MRETQVDEVCGALEETLATLRAGAMRRRAVG
jgi:hypothetical protein